VDEWIETGAQVSAAIALIERQGGAIAGVATIHMDDCERTRELARRFPCRWVWRDAE
jgi:adenine phosphoribosyltransferase